jgi:hypothetical protein
MVMQVRMAKIEQLLVVSWLAISLLVLFSMVRDPAIRSKKTRRVWITPVYQIVLASRNLKSRFNSRIQDRCIRHRSFMTMGHMDEIQIKITSKHHILSEGSFSVSIWSRFPV